MQINKLLSVWCFFLQLKDVTPGRCISWNPLLTFVLFGHVTCSALIWIHLNKQANSTLPVVSRCNCSMECLSCWLLMTLSAEESVTFEQETERLLHVCFNRNLTGWLTAASTVTPTLRARNTVALPQFPSSLSVSVTVMYLGQIAFVFFCCLDGGYCIQPNWPNNNQNIQDVDEKLCVAILAAHLFVNLNKALLTRERQHLHSCRIGDFGLEDVDFVILIYGSPPNIWSKSERGWC